MLMKKRVIWKILTYILAAVTLSVAPAFGDSMVKPDSEYSNLHIITLENGLTLFVREDSSSALLHAEFMCRAGFSSQTASTAGFFPLYTELFAAQLQSDYTDFFKTVKLNYSCNQDSSTYSTSLPPSALETFIKSISECVLNPSFSDRQISDTYSQMKKEVLENERTSTGLINSAIDSRVFSDAPWKHDTGIYPALFAGRTTSEVRTILSDITRKFYIPDNAAFFISGNISHQKVYALAKEYLSEWKSAYPHTIQTSDTSPKANPSSKDKKKFVITDEAFSTDFTQLVVQFTSLRPTQADILSAAFNTVNSTYREYELSQPAIGLRSADYITSASVQQSSSSRMILQALLEKPYSFTFGPKPQNLPGTAEQAMLFVEQAKKAASLSPQSFAQAQNEISSRYRTRSGSAVEGMDFLADYWALHPELSPENFYSHFESLQQAVKEETPAEIFHAVQQEEPYIFVLVNNKIYQKERGLYESLGFELVTRNNASWYRDELVLNNALKEENLEAPQNTELALDEEKESKNPAQNFFDINSAQIKNTSLSNGIPLLVKTNPKSQGILISICIDGGESASPQKEHLQRTLIVNYLSVNLQAQINSMKAENLFHGETAIKTWTNDYKSYLTISCLNEDLENSLTAFVNAILYGGIVPSTADRVMYDLYGQWNTKISDMDFQMTQSALKALYKGTSLEKNYDIQTPILNGTTFKSLTAAYDQLINAENYSMVIVGDIGIDEAKVYAEKTFCLLKGKYPAKKNFKLIKPSIKNRTDRVNIKHTYATDIPAEMAGDYVPILVPTTEFKDPVQFYFSAPEDDESREIFNALLYDLQRRIELHLNGEAKCFVTPASNTVPMGCVKTTAILYTQDFLSAYKKSVSEMKAELKAVDESNNSTAEALLANIKTRWELKALEKTQTNEGTAELLQQGLITGNAKLYLNDYVNIEKADLKKFIKVADKYFPDAPTYSIYSKDAK